MSMRSPSRLAVSRHVYLRTQQRRLRHVKSITLRNLIVPESKFSLESPLALATHFTIHPPHSEDTVLYESEPALETYNPSWEAIHFTLPDYSKYAALSEFILKVWLGHLGNGRVSTNERQVLLRKSVSLVDLAYLGTLVNKDGSGYPPNTLVVGMFEGYYTHPTVNGIISPPKVMHSLTDLLPPMSLLEVSKSEVQDSYHHPTLKRILNRQEVLNSTTSVAKQRREAVKRYKVKEQTYFEHRQERERLSMQIKMLQQQLKDEQLIEAAERKALSELKAQLDSQEESLSMRVKKLAEEKEQYAADHQHHCKRVKRLARFEQFRNLRERTMVHELGQTFFITQTSDAFAICNIILPNADQHDQASIHDQLAVGLGYVAQLVHHLAAALSVPLQYPLLLNGSKSSIFDHISDISAVQTNRDFPLFPRGSEKEVFMYAVYLLNKDICQLRQFTGLGVSKSNFKHTLRNLKTLIDRLTGPMISPVQPEMEFSLQPISVPTPTVSSNHIHSGSRDGTSMATPPSQSSVQDGYSALPSESLSLYQENQLLHRHGDSASPEPTADSAVQSPPLQFELHDAYLHPSRPSHTPSPAYAIQPKPASMFPLLSPIYSDGSPSLTEDGEWATQSHSHADLHKVGVQHLGEEPSLTGMGLRLMEEEEELGAVGAGGSDDIIMLAEPGNNINLSSNGISDQPHRTCQQNRQLEVHTENSNNSVTVSSDVDAESRQEWAGSDGLALTEVKSTDTLANRHQREERWLVDEQGFPLSDESSSMNPFKEELSPPPTIGVHEQSPTNDGYVNRGLATPHMLSSVWEAELEETQITGQASQRQAMADSSGRTSHFLEDFID